KEHKRAVALGGPALLALVAGFLSVVCASFVRIKSLFSQLVYSNNSPINTLFLCLRTLIEAYGVDYSPQYADFILVRITFELT
ncbi:MAG: hypothetical protein AAGA62_00225, partial [Bacteroidota bacterium]